MYAINQERGQALMTLARNREYDQACKAIWDKYKNGAFTNETVNAVYKDFCELINVMVKPEFREEAIKNLKERFQLIAVIDN